MKGRRTIHTSRRGVAAMFTISLMAAACAKPEQASTDSTRVSTMVPETAVKAPGVPDAEMQAVLDELAALHGLPVETLTAVDARKQPTPTDAVMHLLSRQGRSAAPPAGATLVNRTVAGAAGQLPANIYMPDGAGPFPIVVYFHGGGWVIANKDVYDGGARALAIGAQAVVVSADYRSGPEHTFPAAHDDALAVYKWAIANAAAIKGDAKRVALAGESAGGNLAVATAIAARDKSLQAPLAIIAVYPIASGDTTSAAYVENANAKPLNRAMMSWFFENALRSPADRMDPRINLVAADLHGLPPVTIINAQIDPLRTDGEVLAAKLRGAGVAVDQTTYDGVTHEFFGMGAVHAKARAAEARAADALKRAFAR